MNLKSAQKVSTAPAVSTTAKQENRLAFFFLLPTLIILIGLVSYPSILAIVYSFSRKLVGGDASFVGFANYIELFKNAIFQKTVWNSVIYTFGSVTVKLFLGLGMALVLNQSFKFRNVFRGLLFLPWAIPSLTACLTWKLMYDANAGVYNYILFKLGLIKDFIYWLSDADIALYSVMALVIWKGTPFHGIMLLAGLQSIPDELYEAAEVDGASVVRKFLHITLPSLKDVLIIVYLLSSIWTFHSFQFVYVLTGGGPSHSTQIFPVLSYELGIANMRLGMGAAVSIISVPFIFILIILLTRKLIREE
jgi:multiple sugar transport system permease protein